MTKLTLLLASACLIAAPLSQAAAQIPGSRTLTAQDLFSLEQATDPQVRPGGKQVVYVRASNDINADRARRSIWIVDAATGAQQPLVAGTGNAMSPRWSPDGKRLAYVSTAEGSAQLFVRWMDSGATARVATLPEAPDSIAWSPDGRSIAFLMFTGADGLSLTSGPAPKKPDGATWAEPLKIIEGLRYKTDSEGFLKPGAGQIYAVSAEGGAPRQLTSGASDNQGPLSWSRDGQKILFSSAREAGWEHDPALVDLYELTVANGAVKRLTDRVGPDLAPSVSPDGKLIAYLGFDDKKYAYHDTHLYVANADGSNPRRLAPELDRSVDDFRWSDDSRSLTFQYVDYGVTRLGRAEVSGKASPLAAFQLGGGGLDRPYSGGAFDMKSGVVAYTRSGVDRPADLYIKSGAAASVQATRLNEDLLGARTLGRVEALAVKSSIDGREVPAWLVYPPNYDPARKYPLILEIHGGPNTSYGPYFATDMQLYAAAGYIVLYTNPRGSTSYGEEFANLIDKKYPGPDYDDLISAVDAAIAAGHVDERNLFVTGGSGGGVLTAWIIGKTDRFRAAATQKPVINWTTEALTSDIPTVTAGYWFAKMPWEDQKSYWERSPLSLVGNVKTPTLVVVGENDYRTPVSEAAQYYQALQLRKVPSAFVIVPGASHGGIAARPSQSAAKAGAIIAWFEKYRVK
ncbi:MAG: S9 family peptidase [Caulobacteraceae bacterium]|nr:MAG: S9 family peptidase [Caulobacteraceae bacterium]